MFLSTGRLKSYFVTTPVQHGGIPDTCSPCDSIQHDAASINAEDWPMAIGNNGQNLKQCIEAKLQKSNLASIHCYHVE